MSIKILIVGETRLLCNVVKHLLEKEEDMEVICVTSTSDAVNHLENSQGDLVLVQSEQGSKTALSTVQTLAFKYPAVKVMVIDLPQSKDNILPFLESGASGYILRSDSAEEMMEKIMAVHHGQPIICPEIAAAIINRLADWAGRHHSPQVMQESLAELTRRESEVLELLAENLSNQEIAQSLVIEVGTVKNHVHRILKKLNVRNRTAAAALLPAVQP